MTSRHRIVRNLSAAITALAIASIGAAQTTQVVHATPADAYPANTVVATIDGQPLTLEELLFRYASLSDRARRAYTATDEGMARFLDDVVAGLLVVREADRLDLEQSELGQRLQGLRREDALRDLYARTTVLSQLDDATLGARYQEQIDRFRVPLRVRASHILIKMGGKDPASAGAASRQVLSRVMALHLEIKGGADFAEVARRASDDLTASKGGDLGWVETGVLVEKLEKAVFALEVGEVSQVIKSKLGYHIATVTARREAGVLTFSMVRELILQEMIGERRQQLSAVANSTGQKLRETHRVEVFPDRLPW